MIKREKKFIYKKNSLAKKVTISIFGIDLFKEYTESNWPCDMESIERNKKNKENNERIGFKN